MNSRARLNSTSLQCWNEFAVSRWKLCVWVTFWVAHGHNFDLLCWDGCDRYDLGSPSCFKRRFTEKNLELRRKSEKRRNKNFAENLQDPTDSSPTTNRNLLNLKRFLMISRWYDMIETNLIIWSLFYSESTRRNHVARQTKDFLIRKWSENWNFWVVKKDKRLSSHRRRVIAAVIYVLFRVPSTNWCECFDKMQTNNKNLLAKFEEISRLERSIKIDYIDFVSDALSSPESIFFSSFRTFWEISTDCWRWPSHLMTLGVVLDFLAAAAVFLMV